MKSRFIPVLFMFIAGIVLALPGTASAQQSTWVQIEAHRTLAEAEARARDFSASFPNVVGFRVAGGWYAIALGPYTRPAAEAELSALKSGRLIPSDSYIAFSSQYAQQYWPVGANSLFDIPQSTQTALPGTPPPSAPEAPAVPEFIADETPRQARASEAALDADARRLLQESLTWEGFYSADIDGAFGPGTRQAMADWQAAMGYEATGVLTTNQRAELVKGYRAAFSDLGLAAVQDTSAGIDIVMPTGKVAFTRAEAPFVHYNSTDEDGVRVLLISQTGNEATLFGLYDIMQTLEIVPLEGFRERQTTSFVLTGQSATQHSYTYARIDDGAVKGFSLVWKPEDAKVMNRVAETMRESFRPIAGRVLPDTALSGESAEQRIDLMAGLELRRPDRSRSGFFVDGSGLVLTTTDVLGQCRRVTIGEEIEADVAARDDALGLALLKPRQSLTPLAVAEFQGGVPRINSEVALAGFAYEDVLDLPVLTFGTLADVRGLQGEDFVERLDMETLPGDAGGPVFDSTGAVLGMLRARDADTGRQLPPGVNFAVDVPAIAAFLGETGLSPRASDRSDALPPEDLVALAGDVTVRISCWN